VHVRRSSSPTARRDVELPIHGGRIHVGGGAVYPHVAVHRAHAHVHALWHEHVELDAHIVVPKAWIAPVVAVRFVAMLVAVRVVAPQRTDHDALLTGTVLLGLDANDGRIATPPPFDGGDLDVVATRRSDGDRTIQVADANRTSGE